MKTIKSFFAVMVLTAFGVTASSQTETKTSGQNKTETFKVWGKCTKLPMMFTLNYPVAATTIGQNK